MWPFKEKPEIQLQKSKARQHFESLTVGSHVLIMGETKGVVVSSTADEWNNDSEYAELPTIVVLYSDKTGKMQKQSLSPTEALVCVVLWNNQQMYKYNFSISLPGIEADSLEEAEKKAYAMLNDLAKSNDGSEFLANAQIDYRGCTHAKPYTSSVEESNCGASDCCEPQTSLQPPNCANVPW